MYKLSPKNVGLFPSPKVEGNVGFFDGKQSFCKALSIDGALKHGGQKSATIIIKTSPKFQKNCSAKLSYQYLFVIQGLII